MNNLFDGLNADQLKAVTATEGYLRVIAGAGSGKTKTLTHRYGYLVKAAGIHPSNVLCVTFTAKAAGEMKRRVQELVGDGYDNSLITTYHGFCVRVLRGDIHHLMWPESFAIIDESTKRKLLSEIYAEEDIRMDQTTYERVVAAMHRLKSYEEYVRPMVDGRPEDVAFNDKISTDGLDIHIIRRFLKKQKQIYGLDFDDLISFTFSIFGSFPEVAQKWAEQLYYIEVDEFQDSSKRELRLIKTLCSAHKNLFVVGDPDQNIYEWRGADMSIIVNFEQNFPGAETITLNRNYRSTGNILSAANALIAYNTNRVKKDLYTESPPGEPVRWLHLRTEEEEGKAISSEIKKLISQGFSYRNIAILYRAGFLSRFVEAALGAAHIPYELYGSVRFYDRMEIKDALAYMRLIVSDDDEAFERVINLPRRNFGKSRLAALKAMAEESGQSLFAALKASIDNKLFSSTGVPGFVELIDSLRKEKDNLSVSALLGEALGRSGYEDYIRAAGSMERLDNLAELKRSLWNREQAWGEKMTPSQWLDLIDIEAAEEKDSDSDKVKLMTIHAAKGLEFPAVFVVGMTEGIFPSSRTLEERKNEGLEEERRLCFVALTRAQKQLFLTDSEGGEEDRRKRPSRFLYDIGENNLVRTGEISKELQNKSTSAAGVDTADSASGLSPGDRVNHPIFGEGTIERKDERKNVYYIRFDNKGEVRPVSADYDFAAWSGIGEAADKALEKAESRKILPGASPSAKTEAKLPELPSAEPVSAESLKPEKPTEKESSEISTKNEIDTVKAETNNPDKPDKNDKKEDHAQIKFSLESIEEETETEETSIEAAEYQAEPTETEEKTDPEAAIPARYRNAEWMEEPSDGETNLWKRNDVPHSGWYCTGVIDLGAPVGTCRMCGYQIIRYVHVMRHNEYPRAIGAGCICAGNMEGSAENAKKREYDYKNRLRRRKNFLNTKFKRSRSGNSYFKYKGEIVTVIEDKFKRGFFKTVYKGGFSLPFDSVENALSALFDQIDPWDYRDN
ncbi:MAG: ATP-dependent helicase [Eubacteriales bacterium]|jgi:DNA helicase-2/ATP-dependent DNA helicase PcrA